MVDSKQQWKAWLYLAPAIVLLLVFTVWPIFNTVRMAFLENYSGLKAAGGQVFEFGIGNFVKVIKYQRFLNCLKNTVLICVLTVPISTILALLIAVALNSIKGLQKILQTVFFLPYVTNSIAIGMVFAAMFNIVGSFFGNVGQEEDSLQTLLQELDRVQGNCDQQCQDRGDRNCQHAQQNCGFETRSEAIVLNDLLEVLNTKLKLLTACRSNAAVTILEGDHHRIDDGPNRKDQQQHNSGCQIQPRLPLLLAIYHITSPQRPGAPQSLH